MSTIVYILIEEICIEDNHSCYINYILSLYYHIHGQVHKLYLKHIQMDDPCVVLQINEKIDRIYTKQSAILRQRCLEQKQ